MGQLFTNPRSSIEPNNNESTSTSPSSNGLQSDILRESLESVLQSVLMEQLLLDNQIVAFSFIGNFSFGSSVELEFQTQRNWLSPSTLLVDTTSTPLNPLQLPLIILGVRDSSQRSSNTNSRARASRTRNGQRLNQRNIPTQRNNLSPRSIWRNRLRSRAGVDESINTSSNSTIQSQHVQERQGWVMYVIGGSNTA